MDFFIFPIKNSRMIPKEWLEELFPTVDVVESFTKLEESVNDPNNCLIGIYNNHNKKIEGFLWGEKHPILPTLFVLSLYICKAYRKNPKTTGLLIEYLKSNGRSMGYDDVLFMTDKPNFFIKRNCVSDKHCVRLNINEV